MIALRPISVLVAGCALLFATAQTPTAITYGNERMLDEINTSEADAYPWISSNGLWVYYTRDNGSTNVILRSYRPTIADDFGPGTAVLPLFNGDEVGGWLSANELTIWFVSNLNVMRATRPNTSAPFGTPVPVTISGLGSFPMSPTLTPNQQELFIYSFAGIQRCLLAGTDSYTAVGYLMTGTLNTGPCKLSADGLKIYFSGEMAGIVRPHRMSRSTLTDLFSDLEYLAGDAFVLPYRWTQPHLSANELVLVGARAQQNVWSTQDLFTADGVGSTSIQDQWQPVPHLVPNPASEEAVLRLPYAWPSADVMIYDAQGRLCLNTRVTMPSAMLSLTTLATGIHTVIFAHEHQRLTERLVVER